MILQETTSRWVTYTRTKELKFEVILKDPKGNRYTVTVDCKMQNHDKAERERMRVELVGKIRALEIKIFETMKKHINERSDIQKASAGVSQ